MKKLFVLKYKTEKKDKEKTALVIERSVTEAFGRLNKLISTEDDRIIPVDNIREVKVDISEPYGVVDVFVEIKEVRTKGKT